MATEKKTKTVSLSSVKEPATETKKATPAPKQPAAEAKKAAPKKPAAAKKAPAKKPAAKAAPKKAEEVLMLQAAGGEWNVADIKESAIAAYVAEGHTRASIKSLTVYLKPEERTAYYVINEKVSGSIAL